MPRFEKAAPVGGGMVALRLGGVESDAERQL